MNIYRHVERFDANYAQPAPPVDHKGGFTLAEVLVVCAVASILAVAAAPGFGELLRENRLSARMTDFANAHRIARSESVSRGRAVSICKSADATTATPSCGADDSSWANGWIVFVNTDADAPAALDAGETVLVVSSGLRAGDTLRGSASVNSYVTYEPTGEIVANGTLVLCEGGDPSRSRALLLSTTGRVRIAQRNSDGMSLANDGSPLDSCSP